jgi:hypothetical protein
MPNGEAKEFQRIRTLPCRIVIREELSNIPCPGSPEDRIRYRMRDRVSIGMAGEAMGEWDRLPAQDQGPAGCETVGVVPDADAQARRSGHATPTGVSMSE